MNEELRHCPFCGKQPEVGHYETFDNDEWYIGCDCECGPCTKSHLTYEQAIAAWNARTERTCKCVAKYANSPIDGKTIVLHRCSACHELMRPHMHYCPNCGAKIIEEKGKGND